MIFCGCIIVHRGSVFVDFVGYTYPQSYIAMNISQINCLKFYGTINLPAKLSPNKPIKFWYSMNIGLHKWKWFHCITGNFFLRFRQNGNQMKNLCLINYIYYTKKASLFLYQYKHHLNLWQPVIDSFWINFVPGIL